MLVEFRALGGTADNIRLADGPLGRGIFPIDPAKPVAILVPENLLLDVADLRIENGAFRVAPGAPLGDRERRFLEDYEGGFSWGGGGRRDIEALFEQAQALPDEIRARLKAEFRCGDWFGEASDAALQERFFSSRSIAYGERNVVMPVMELVNHGDQASYDTARGVALRGLYAGEVNVRYGDCDAYGLFVNWGFSHPQKQALSMALSGTAASVRLHIERDHQTGQMVPKLARDGDALKLNFLMIGHRQYQRMPRGVFYKLLREARVAGFEEAFDMVQHINKMNFINLLALLEPFEGPLVTTLRRMARRQLEAMSFACGARTL